jgi:hypothetical protein
MHAVAMAESTVAAWLCSPPVRQPRRVGLRCATPTPTMDTREEGRRAREELDGELDDEDCHGGA